MNLREALINQAPSLELQRAASNEIARLDDRLVKLDKALHIAMGVLQETVINYQMYAMDITDPQHPWHEDIKAIQELRALHRSILDIPTYKVQTL